MNSQPFALLFSATFFIALAGSARVAQAESATVTLKQGGAITGKLVEYVATKKVVLSLGANKLFEADASEISGLQIGEGSQPCGLEVAADLLDGSRRTGTLKEYRYGDHVTLALDGSKVVTFTAKQLKTVSVKGSASEQCKQGAKPAGPQPLAAQATLPPVAAAPLSEMSRAAAVQSLMNERADWQSKWTGLAAPVLFSVVSVIAIATCVGLQAAYQNSSSSEYYNGRYVDKPKDSGLNTASIGVGIGGGVFAAAAITTWLLRTSDGRQQRELQRIDQQLLGLGIQAHLSPWIAPSAKHTAGGLNLTLNM